MSTAPIKTREGLAAAIALKFRTSEITVNVTFEKKDVRPYRATISKARRIIGYVTGPDLNQLKNILEDWIGEYLENNKIKK